MYVRISRVQAPPERIGDLVETFRGKVLSDLRAMPGYAGCSMAADTSSGDAQVATFWDSREALEKGREQATGLRSIATEGIASITSVKEYEQLFMERFTTPSPPAFLRVTRCTFDTSKVDQLASDMRNEAVPAVRALAGARALTAGVDRATGEGVVTSVWDSAANREASDSALDSLRRRIFEAAGAQQPEVSLYEVFVVEFVGVGAATN